MVAVLGVAKEQKKQELPLHDETAPTEVDIERQWEQMGAGGSLPPLEDSNGNVITSEDGQYQSINLGSVFDLSRPPPLEALQPVEGSDSGSSSSDDGVQPLPGTLGFQQL